MLLLVKVITVVMKVPLLIPVPVPLLGSMHYQEYCNNSGLRNRIAELPDNMTSTVMSLKLESFTVVALQR